LEFFVPSSNTNKQTTRRRVKFLMDYFHKLRRGVGKLIAISRFRSGKRHEEPPVKEEKPKQQAPDDVSQIEVDIPTSDLETLIHMSWLLKRKKSFLRSKIVTKESALSLLRSSLTVGFEEATNFITNWVVDHIEEMDWNAREEEDRNVKGIIVGKLLWRQLLQLESRGSFGMRAAVRSRWMELAYASNIDERSERIRSLVLKTQLYTNQNTMYRAVFFSVLFNRLVESFCLAETTEDIRKSAVDLGNVLLFGPSVAVLLIEKEPIVSVKRLNHFFSEKRKYRSSLEMLETVEVHVTSSDDGECLCNGLGELLISFPSLTRIGIYADDVIDIDDHRFLVELAALNGLAFLHIEGARGRFVPMFEVLAKDLRMVTSLTLSSLRFGDLVGKELCLLLIASDKRNFKYLDISDNDMKNESGTALATLFSMNRSLQHVDLSSNFFGSVGSVEIAESLPFNLSSLRWQHTSLSLPCVSRIASRVAWSKMVELHLCDACINDSSGVVLLKQITSRGQLEVLDLSENFLQEDSLIRLRRCLATNRSLKKVILHNMLPFNSEPWKAAKEHFEIDSRVNFSYIGIPM
jgi:hypothetical protein